MAVACQGNALKGWDGASNHEREALTTTGAYPAGNFINMIDKFNYS